MSINLVKPANDNKSANELKYQINPCGEDFIITVLEQGDYYGVPVKITDLKFDETGSAEFGIELPEKAKELFKDEKFKEMIEKMVGDSIQKATTSLFNAQKDLMEIEEKVSKIVKSKNIKYDENKAMIELFAEKNYLLTKDKDKIVAVNLQTGETFDVENDDSFEKLRKIIFPVIVLEGIN